MLPDRRTDQRMIGHNSQARLSQAEARRILGRVHGMTATEALAALRFGAGTTCPAIARIVAEAVEQARSRDIGPDELVVSGGEVGEGEQVVRVRRLAHGMADWITTETTDIRVELVPAEGAHR